MKQLCDKISGFLKGIRQVTLSLFRFRTTLTEQKVVLVEIGGRGGPSFGWRLLLKLGLVEIHGFEPDLAEANRLAEKGLFSKVHPFALGGEKGTFPLYLTAHRGCSSLRKPLAESFQNLSIRSWLEVEKTEDVEVVTLPHLLDAKELPSPSFLAIDAQGAERDILQGGAQFLDKVLGISMECRLSAMYEGEATFEELRIMLQNQGFELRDLRVVGSFDELAYEFDCYFSRKNDGQSASEKKLLKWWEQMHGLRPPKPAGALTPFKN